MQYPKYGICIMYVILKHQTDTMRIWRIANHMNENKMLPCKAYSCACLISCLAVFILKLDCFIPWATVFSYLKYNCELKKRTQIRLSRCQVLQS